MGRAVRRTKRPRASISFDARQYLLLERLAQEKKVSVAWVVREAVDSYVTQYARLGVVGGPRAEERSTPEDRAGPDERAKPEERG